jgi:hypothetical protein
VDDTTTYEVTRKNFASQAQAIVDEITRWSNLNKFELHPKKCKELRISFSRLPTNRELIHFDGSIVEPITSIKILGVHFQNNLKWNSHINATVKKAAKRLYFLVQLKHAKVPNQELVEFYVTCIQSVLTYACQVYHFALPEYLSLLLERIKKRAMCIIYGYDVSYKDALTNSGLSNLHQRRSELCRNFFNKLLMNSEDKLHVLFYHLM